MVFITLKTCILTMYLLLFSNFQINSNFLSNISLGIYKLTALFMTHFLVSLIYPLTQLWIVFLTPIPTLKGSISYVYNQINLLRPEPLGLIKSLWEDQGVAISEGVWTEILRRVHKSSICARQSYSVQNSTPYLLY